MKSLNILLFVTLLYVACALISACSPQYNKMSHNRAVKSKFRK